MSHAVKSFKKYNFINHVERWTTSQMTKFGSGISPTPGNRQSDGIVDYSKTSMHCHVMANGDKTIKVHYTEKKATDFRNFMNKTLAEAAQSGWFSNVSGCAMYNRIDEDYGTSVATHGDYKMSDLFWFSDSDYSVRYQHNYNFWDRIDRLKTLGLMNDDLSIDTPFHYTTHSFPSEVTMRGMPDGRDLCMTFAGDVSNQSALSSEWNSKAYLIPNETVGLTISKQGQMDTLVCANDFELEVVGEGPNINVEVGRPMRLESFEAQFNPSRRGLIFHVWK